MKNWLNQINKNTEAFQHHFGQLNEAQLNWKPNPKTWSIAQNIDHLMVINKTYFPILNDLKSGNYRPPLMSKLGFMVSFLGKMIYNSVKPENKKKIKTFPIWQPAESTIKGDVLIKFAKHQEELKQAISNTESFVKKGQVIHSPANKNIVYKLATAFDVIVAHEERHLEQAKEVLELLNAQAK